MPCCPQVPTMVSREWRKREQWHLITIWPKLFSPIFLSANSAYIVSDAFEPLIPAAFYFVQVMLMVAGHSPGVRLPRRPGQCVSKQSSPHGLTHLAAKCPRCFSWSPSKLGSFLINCLTFTENHCGGKAPLDRWSSLKITVDRNQSLMRADKHQIPEAAESMIKTRPKKRREKQMQGQERTVWVELLEDLFQLAWKWTIAAFKCIFVSKELLSCQLPGRALLWRQNVIPEKDRAQTGTETDAKEAPAGDIWFHPCHAPSRAQRGRSLMVA